jgi:hypothetical protein
LELTLRYHGDLPSFSSGRARVVEKHKIRSAFQEQLAVLWQRDLRLRNIKLDQLQVAKRTGKHFDVDRPILSQQHFFGVGRSVATISYLLSGT